MSPHPKMSRMSDPTAMAAGQPSEEEMRAYLDQLREADAAGLIAEAFNLLATGAQVKLGRPDARALIDGLNGLVQAAAPVLPPQLVEQMNSGIGQLQLAQVQAERDMAAAGAPPEGGGAASEQPAGADAPTPPPAGGPPPGPGGNQRMTDRLWVPGRGDPRPPGR